MYRLDKGDYDCKGTHQNHVALYSYIESMEYPHYKLLLLTYKNCKFLSSLAKSVIHFSLLPHGGFKWTLKVTPVYANYFYDTSVIFSNSTITYRELFTICIGHDRRTDVIGIDCDPLREWFLKTQLSWG